MPSLKAIRTRIASVKNTQKITKALKLVAAAGLRRAQEAIWAARPYARSLEDVIAEVAARAGADAHPLLETRAMRRIEVIALTSDRGQAGAFNSNINRALEKFLVERQPQHEQILVSVLGRKGRDYARRRKIALNGEWLGVSSARALELARALTEHVAPRYAERQVDGAFIIYNEFKSAISQKVQVEQILPVRPKKLPPGQAGDLLYEPSRAAVLDSILPLYVEIEVYRAILESIASEFGARMSAMENATKNANEMIAKYTLQYNRARQAAITKELLEIIGGAEALKG
ncbi:MAG TPA: ATP synthase F1 subunit gamma [Haliangiales bacterium]|nr:ATP synthase F1 subunit gamma [Haliangiales bacterium]